MGIFKGKEIFTMKPWLTDYKQNVEQLKKILGLSYDNMLPTIEEGDEGKVVGVSSGKYALVEGGGGSSDFSTATVTIGGSEDINIPLVCLLDGGTSTIYSDVSTREAGTTWTVPLYKGCLAIVAASPLFSSVTVSGNASVLAEGVVLQITGDCTITGTTN